MNSRSKLMVSIACVVVLFVGVGQADATVILNVSEVGADVVATGSGSLDISALSYSFTFGPFAQMFPQVNGSLIVGPAGSSPNSDVYTGISGPTAFGVGPGGLASLGAGTQHFGIGGNLGQVFVPQGYTSGSALNGSSTWSGQSFASLGITPGTYVWTWGSGGNADSITLNAVPEPSTALLLATGLAALGARRRREP